MLITTIWAALAVTLGGMPAPGEAAIEPPGGALAILAPFRDEQVPQRLPVAGTERSARAPEFLQMFWMIVTKGADMGPTDGWFRPGESRYGWDWLRSRDQDGDGSISAEELGGTPELFARLDRDHSGLIAVDDLDWSPQSAFLRQQSAARRRFTMIDANANGKISQEEWDAFFQRAARDKGALSIEDLSLALDPPPAPPGPRDASGPSSANDGPSRWTLLDGLFKGDLGSRFEGPRIGDLAPDFTLRTHDGLQEITLSTLRGAKPVVLIFGSFT